MHVDSVLDSLTRSAREEPARRRLLVARNRGVGREVLRRLALDGPGGIGFEHATPASLAQELVAAELAREGLSLIDELEQRAIVDEALDAALAGDQGLLAALGEGVGFRDAVANAIQALRLAGVSPGDLRAARIDDASKKQALASVLESYEQRLVEGRRVDQADVFRRAIAEVEAEGIPDARILIIPDLGTRGLAGRFIEAVAARGAEVLPAVAIAGLSGPVVLSADGNRAKGGEVPRSRLAWLHAVADAPGPEPNADDGVLDLFASVAPADDVEIELFAAGSPTDELREVLRRVLASGHRWDEVEIVATDPIVYGCALDALASRLGIPVTYAVGVPLERARQGRAATAYLRWIQEDFPAAILRELLENGDVRPYLGRTKPAGDDADRDRGPSGERLARRLRYLRVGWGRDRYLETIDAAIRWLDAAPPEPEDDPRPLEQIAESRAREREELLALRSLVDAILGATPAVPDRLGRGPRRVSPEGVAQGLLGFLAYVPAPTPV
ncbi:MAG: hypothetical protein ABR593_06620, partial [Candidatus Limnocylindria bacterium]